LGLVKLTFGVGGDGVGATDWTKNKGKKEGRKEERRASKFEEGGAREETNVMMYVPELMGAM